MAVPPPVPPSFFAQVGAAIASFFTGKASVGAYLQAALFTAQGVMSHKAAMKAKRKGADILLQKYGTGQGMPVIYGSRRVGSTVVYMETKNNKELFVVYALAGHEIDAFDLGSIELDGRTIDDDNVYRQGYDLSDGTTRIKYRNGSATVSSGTYWGNTTAERNAILAGANDGSNARMTFNLHHGTTTQAADPMLEGILTDWTSNHKLTGIAYIAANFEYDTKGMFSGIPNLSIVVKGKKVYDPRKDGSITGGTGSHRSNDVSTFEWSDNAALCLLDYISNDDYGKGLDLTETTGDIDLSSFQTAATDSEATTATIPLTLSVTSASTFTDILVIANADEVNFGKLKEGNLYTVTAGGTTFINNKRLLHRSYTRIRDIGTTPIPQLRLHFEKDAVDTAITTTTSCSFSQTERRFHCNGVVDTDESVIENTKLLISNMRGIFTYSNGKYSIEVEGTETPVQTLNEDHILDAGIQLSLENKEQKYNKVEVEFFNSQKRYETDTTYYTGESSDSFLTDDGGEVLETRVQFPFVTNQRIAHNHAFSILKRSRSQRTISFLCSPRVLLSRVGEVIAITNSDLGLSAEQYRITNMVIQPELNIEVTAVEYQGAIYGYNTPPEEDLGIIKDPVEPNRALAPSSLTFTDKNQSTGVPARLTWTDSSNYPSYKFNVLVKDSSSNIRFDGETRNEFYDLDGIEVGNNYSAEISAVNSLGFESAASTLNFNVATPPISNPDIGDDQIDADHISVTNLAAINADMGTITAGTIDADNITVQNLEADNIKANGLNNVNILADAFLGDYGVEAGQSGNTSLTTSFQTLESFTIPASKESGTIGILAFGDVGNTATSNSQVRFDIFHGGTSVANYTSSVGVEAALAPFVLAAQVAADTTQTKTFELKGKKLSTDPAEALTSFNCAILAIKVNSSGFTT